jgi:hypothetical protein
MSLAQEFEKPQHEVLMDIPVTSLFIPDGRRISIKWDTPDAVAFLDNLRRQGLLHPLQVRKAENDRYEIVAGRRRFMAAKQLKWKFILCRVGECTDDEVKFVHLSENRHRKQMNYREVLRIKQALLAEEEKLFGKDPGRKIGGWKRAVQAVRSKDGKFTVGKKEESQPEPGENAEVELDPALSSEEPSRATVAPAGDDATKQGETEVKVPKSFSRLLSEQTGTSLRQSKRDILIMSTLGAERLRDMDAQDLTMKDLEKLAKIKDPEKRNLACKKIAMNTPIEQVLAEADSDAEAIKARQERMLSDNDWVKTYCAKPLSSIQNQAAFFDAAILHRKIRDNIADFRKHIRKAVEAAHAMAPNPYTWQLLAVIGTTHPDNWPVCRSCLGRNRDHPTCPECKGHGYTLRIEWPKRRFTT